MESTTFIEQTLEECKRRLYRTLRDLTPAELAWRPASEANSIGFIVWHVARVEDRWLQRFAQDGTEVWLRDGWAQRCRLPEGETGVGYTAEQVVGFSVPPLEDIQTYFDAARQETLAYLQGIETSELDVAPKRTPFPEVGQLPEDFTIGRMFRQLIGEENQHLGQVSFLRGLQRGLNK